MDSNNFSLRPLDLLSDAAKLAKMWNDSDDQWPGSFTNGVHMTAESVIDWLKGEDLLDSMIWDTGEEIAGYCSWSKNLKELDVYYIPLLNVSPKYQKHSLARKFLVHFIDRTVKVGGKRLDLHTWSGNLKAVPLYKKCGFRWMPKTDVYMLNFIPWLLNMPILEDFFQRNYWYNVQVCELNQEENDEHLGKANVFTYKFVGNDESIVAWFDRDSRALIGIDTPEFKITSIPETLNPIKGMRTYIQLELENKCDNPMPITLITESSEDFVTSFQRSIDGIDNQMIKDIIDIDVKSVFPNIYDTDPAKSIKTNIVVNNQLIEFANGFRPTEALNVNTYPKYITAYKNHETHFFLNIHNQSLFDIEYNLVFAESDLYHLEVDVSSSKVDEGSYGLHKLTIIPLTNSSFDIHFCINLKIGNKNLLIGKKYIAVLVRPINGIGLAKEANDTIRVENDTYRVLCTPNHYVTILDVQTDNYVCFYSILAPPLWPNIFRSVPWELSTNFDNGTIIVNAKAYNKDKPNCAITRTLKFNSSNVFELFHTVHNLSELDSKKYISQKLWFNPFHGKLFMPLSRGIINDDCNDFPGVLDNVSKKLNHLQENWFYLKNDYLSVGLVLASDTNNIEYESDSFNIENKEYELSSGECKVFPSYYLVIQPNNYQQVRELYLRTQPDHSRIYPFKPELIESYISAQFDPKIITCNEETDKLWINIYNFTSRKQNGTLVLSSDDPDIYLSSKHFNFNDLDIHTPFTTNISVKVIASEPKPIKVDCILDTPEKTVNTHFNVIKLSKPGKVINDITSVAGIEVHSISNGVLDIDVAPDFAGSVTSIKYRGIEQLISSFPQRSVLGWLSPWFGGIMPLLYIKSNNPANEFTYPGRLYREKFTAEPSAHIDKQFNKWQGVTLLSYIQEENLKGLEFAFSVYTLPFSNVIKLKIGLTNTTVNYQKVNCGFSCFAAPNSNYKNNIIYFEEKEIRPSLIGKWHKAGDWILSTDSDTKFSIGLTSNNPSFIQTGWGNAGNYIDFIPEALLLPKQEIKFEAYLYFINNIMQSEQYNELKFLI